MTPQIILYVAAAVLILSVGLGIASLIYVYKYYHSILKLFAETAEKITENKENQTIIFNDLSKTISKSNQEHKAAEKKLSGDILKLFAEQDERAQQIEKNITESITALNTQFNDKLQELENALLSQHEQNRQELSVVRSNLLILMEEDNKGFSASKTALTALKKESAENWKELSAELAKNENEEQKKFTSLEGELQSLKEESGSLHQDLAAVSKANTQNTRSLIQQMTELQTLLELRFAGIFATLKLLAARPQESSSHKKSNANDDSVKPEKKGKSVPSRIDSNGNHVEFETLPNGKTISRTYRNGKLVFEFLHSAFGTPENGKMYADNGKIIKEFEYDSYGQVK